MKPRKPKGAKKPQLDGFRIPDSFFANLSEFCAGGYILFHFDESGFVKVAGHFDNPAYAQALQHYISNWSSVVQGLNCEALSQEMTNRNGQG